MLHFGLPAADIIAHPTQPFALGRVVSQNLSQCAGSFAAVVTDCDARHVILAPPSAAWQCRPLPAPNCGPGPADSRAFETAIIEGCGRRESPVEEAIIEMRLEGVSVRGSRTLPIVLPEKAKLAGPQALWVKEPGKPDEL